ncbi:MAG: type II glyceraldehyde-3-phosphate dehydrogenase [Desulfurococcaceae archaeon]
MVVKIGINGYGTIGKRIADALTRFQDFIVTGIVKTKPDYGAFIAKSKGFKIYSIRENIDLFKKSNIEIEGSIEDLIEESDLIIDTTPGGLGRSYLHTLYSKYGKSIIFQGGEKHDIVETSFNSICNYEEAFNKKYVRVVSCNTTGLLRIICLIDEEIGVEKVKAVIVRRGADPKEDTRGPINSIVLDPPQIPSHHAIDVKTVLPKLDIETIAFAVPSTLMHVQYLNIFLKEKTSLDRIIEIFSKVKRIQLVNAKETGLDSTSKLIEYARDKGRYRYDIPENIVWLDTMKIDNKELTLVQAIHQESIVIPENIDAVKSITGLERDKWQAIRDTDEKLGLGNLFK